jgi:hypothetical protein
MVAWTISRPGHVGASLQRRQPQGHWSALSQVGQFLTKVGSLSIGAWNSVIVSATEQVIGTRIDVLFEEVHSSVAENEVGSAGVSRSKAPGQSPVLVVRRERGDEHVVCDERLGEILNSYS